MPKNDIKIVSFSNQTSQDKKYIKQFVDFHWQHYKDEPNYVPLLDYEYLGFKLIGMTGFFETRNFFFKHARMRFFMALRDDKIVGRCNAFINDNHNKHWNDKVGFLGQYESINDQNVADALLTAASEWIKFMGMNTIRGPQNFPVNEATPGLLTEGFESRPVLYYHYNKPYYEQLLKNTGLEPIKRVLSWEAPVMRPMEEKLERVAQKVIDRFKVKIETWDERPLKVRRREMFEIYNDAWGDNFGFVPFTEEEFYSIVEDMQLVMDKKLFLFLYVNGEAAAFFGGIPNVSERMVPINGFRRWELLRAAKMLLTKKKVKGFRLGYLGVKKKFRRMGLDGVMLWKQKLYAQKAGYLYCDMGWVLEDNVLTKRLVDLVDSEISKVYTIFQKPV
ncbi:hypothetical protein JXQ31_10770 [candidate division KSB1 bacterium]|nr:hypothetical protein [candidate division KSB1 bacterium]